MIRFPNRFHASDTPQGNEAGQVEIGYQAERGPKSLRGQLHSKHATKEPPFDFTALAEALR